jgi:hypothetical protein
MSFLKDFASAAFTQAGKDIAKRRDEEEEDDGSLASLRAKIDELMQQQQQGGGGGASRVTAGNLLPLQTPDLPTTMLGGGGSPEFTGMRSRFGGSKSGDVSMKALSEGMSGIWEGTRGGENQPMSGILLGQQQGDGTLQGLVELIEKLFKNR